MNILKNVQPSEAGQPVSWKGSPGSEELIEDVGRRIVIQTCFVYDTHWVTRDEAELKDLQSTMGTKHGDFSINLK